MECVLNNSKCSPYVVTQILLIATWAKNILSYLVIIGALQTTITNPHCRPFDRNKNNEVERNCFYVAEKCTRALNRFSFEEKIALYATDRFTLDEKVLNSKSTSPLRFTFSGRKVDKVRLGSCHTEFIDWDTSEGWSYIDLNWAVI